LHATWPALLPPARPDRAADRPPKSSPRAPSWIVSRARFSTDLRDECGRRRPTVARLPALDGLRGAAVIGVLFFHDDRLRGGYLGVDLFFVLSGFLITSLLVAEQRATGRIDLGAFWIRRARRLFPAVLALMPAVALYAAVFAKP